MAEFQTSVCREETIRKVSRYAGRVFAVETHWITQPDDSEALRDVVLHPGGVAVVAYSSAGEVVLVHQYRKAIEQFLWEIPAGKLEKGETPLEAAKRELKEETGYRAQTWLDLGRMYPTPGYCSEIIYLFAALDLESGCAHPDPGEWIESKHFPWEETVMQVEEGRLNDAKTAVGILRLDRILQRRKGEE